MRQRERPNSVTGQTGRRGGEILNVVQIPFDLVGGPLNGEDVEVVAKHSSTRQSIGSTHARTTVVGSCAAGMRAVNRAVIGALVTGLADVLHDVYLATGGPAHAVNVCAEHPERRPDALSTGNFNPRLHAAISPGPFTLGQHSGRGVTARDAVGPGEVLLLGFNDQLAVDNPCIVRAAGIGLKFVITIATATYVITPFGGIW